VVYKIQLGSIGGSPAAAVRLEHSEAALSEVKIRHAPNHDMRNPDPWQPPERTPEPPPASRRAALIGLAMIVLLLLAGLFLTHTLGGMARLQDCALSGRSNCSTNP
jgi:hypothetical protein